MQLQECSVWFPGCCFLVARVACLIVRVLLLYVVVRVLCMVAMLLFE